MKTPGCIGLMIGLAGCTTAASAPATVTSPARAPDSVSHVIQSRFALGQLRRLPDAEAGAAAAGETSPAGDLARVVVALKAQAAEDAAADVMVSERNAEGWRCGRVQFASRGGGFIPFAVRLAPDPVATLLGQDPASVARVRSVCSG